MKNQATKPAINRIVIGDVGSGKTIVAFLIAINYLKGLITGTSCLLAPTEVLAFQHFQKLSELKNDQLKADLDWLEIIYLSSKQIFIGEEKLTKKQLAKHLEQNPQKHYFWIGTHALLFNESIRPDLVLVDEQHRFGVKQRQKLTNNTQVNPHYISFTATPIPRTLALTIYKSLKPHFLETLEARKPIKTNIEFFENLEKNIVPKIKLELEKGRKVYIVCTKIEDKEETDDEAWSINKANTFFAKYFLDEILIVHGKNANKKDVLKEFKESKEKNILIATTVIEVGVDVGEATLIVILNSEKFGLAALHQIRGRVGRNNYPDNQCILVTDSSYRFNKRLKYLCQTQDGFKIAEKDLQLRGSGDMLGVMQSGFGEEIEDLIGLNPELYYQISDLAEKTNFGNLPRLKNYLETKSREVWDE